jgi:hypothetical protein
MIAVAVLAVAPSAAIAQATATTTTTTAATASTDYRRALTKRLAKEYGDPKLAKQVVSGLGADTVSALETKVPTAEVATSPFLAYQPLRVADDDVDALVVFSFGNRIGTAGDLQAGPMNEAIATQAFKFALKHEVPVYAQTEIALQLQAAGMHDVISIDPVTAADGTTTYLSTAGVAEQVTSKAQAAREQLGTVGVIAFADHAARAVLTAREAGMTGAAVPKGVRLPRGYDPESNQAWTRSRAAYLPTDLIGRLTTLATS